MNELCLYLVGMTAQKFEVGLVITYGDKNYEPNKLKLHKRERNEKNEQRSIKGIFVPGYHWSIPNYCGIYYSGTGWHIDNL